MPARKTKPLVGSPIPRIAPPRPARTKLDLFMESCRELEIEPFPWQITAATYLYALGIGEQWLFPENTDVVGRQNGKTEILVPHIVTRLKMARRIMHTAQDRDLPREVFRRVADWALDHRELLASKPRFANGQEEIRMRNGGKYRIVAPTRSGARGPSNDDLIVDEVREQDEFGFMAAAEPTLTASRNPQSFFLSNAGDEKSVVLNALRARAESDPSLAYLEWSADPQYAANDRRGWAQANPSVGHLDGILPYLERKYESYRLSGTLAIFETEHLCRWVLTMRPGLVESELWMACAGPLGTPSQPFMAISMDPEGKRASAAIAWRLSDGQIGLRLTYNVTGNPIDTDRLGEDLRRDAVKIGVKGVGFDPLTDGALAKYFKKPTPMRGAAFANATSTFSNLVAAGKVRWADCDAVTDDLTWTVRKEDRESGSFEAVRVQDDRPITASLAAIRAVGLAASPIAPRPRVR